MHIPEVVDLQYNQGIQLPTTGTGSVADSDYEAGVCLVHRAAGTTIPQATSAAKSSAASQRILGTLAEGKVRQVAKTRGLLVFQAASAYVVADNGLGIITTTTAGKVEANASGVGNIMYGGTDPVIGNYYVVKL